MLEKGTILIHTYRLLEEIGSGGGGIVYKAYHERLKKYVVIKQIRDCVKGILESRAEADILKNLSHMYLPQVFDFFEIDQEVYTVIDFIPGISMEEALKREGRFGQKEVLKWANQLAQALAYLHSQIPSIIHSDIKPANIMLRPTRDICLIDFNVSLAFDAGMRTSTGVSGGYSPPEQYWNYEMYCSMTGTNPEDTREAGGRDSEILLSGRRTELISSEAGVDGRRTEPMRGEKAPSPRRTKLLTDNDRIIASGQPHQTERITQLIGRGVDERSDVYSLGATLYHLLTGYVPADNFEKIEPISRCRVEVSEGFALILEKMMEIFPEKRYQNGMELLQAFQNIHELDSVYQTYRRKRRISGGCLLGAYMLSAMFVGTGIAAISRERNNDYNHMIVMAGDFIEAGEFAQAQSCIEEAKNQMPARIDAYEEELHKYYEMADYDTCIQLGRELIGSPVYTVRSKPDQQALGDMYYILGNAYYEKEDLANALSCFSSALEHYDDNSLYYRDYSIVLAKSGNLGQAEEMLKQAVDLGIGQDSVYLVQGELAYVQGNYQQALELFLSTLNITEDKQLQRRCVLLADRAYRMLGDTFLADEIVMLEKWEQAFGERNSYLITERLADAYTRQGEYEKALRKFEDLARLGYVTYQMSQNLAILHQQLGEFGEAEKILLEAAKQYPKRYEAFKRLAFLEADRQQVKENADRDYHKMKDYYEMAARLYEAQSDQDEEMQMLTILMEDVAAAKWLD